MICFNWTNPFTVFVYHFLYSITSRKPDAFYISKRLYSLVSLPTLVKEVLGDVMEKMVGFCGLVCSECLGFLATQKDDDDERRRVAELWSKQYDADIDFSITVSTF